jgi:hypothetical protein
MIDPTLSADDQQTQTIQGSLFLAKDTTPDVASEAVRLGKTLNLPAEYGLGEIRHAFQTGF